MTKAEKIEITSMLDDIVTLLSGLKKDIELIENDLLTAQTKIYNSEEAENE